MVNMGDDIFCPLLMAVGKPPWRVGNSVIMRRIALMEVVTIQVYEKAYDPERYTGGSFELRLMRAIKRLHPHKNAVEQSRMAGLYLDRLREEDEK